MGEGSKKIGRRALVLGVIGFVFVAWVVWAWTNWGEPGHGINDSHKAVQPAQPVIDAPGGATKARPDYASPDATGDASRGASSYTPGEDPGPTRPTDAER